MKKIFIFSCLFFININLFAEVTYNAKLVKKIKAGTKPSELVLEQRKESSITRELAGGDEYFWGGPSAICFDEDNNLVIFDQHSGKLVIYDENLNWVKDIKTEISTNGLLPLKIKTYKTGVIIYSSEIIYFCDWNGKEIWSELIYNIPTLDVFYYDEETNLLFIKVKNGIAVLLHKDEIPPVGKEDPDPELLINNSAINDYLSKKKITNICVKNEKELYINNQYLPVSEWENLKLIGYDACNNKYSESAEGNVYNRIAGNIRYADDSTTDNRPFRAAVSKTGNIYYLIYSYDTNEVFVYCIENTWAPEAKQKWNELKGSNVSVNKIMTCNENLRLRKEEATSSEIITTMQKGTKVKIVKLGKAETIDGILSNWVQIEVQSGAKDREGKEILQGTTGWCYGGYLQ